MAQQQLFGAVLSMLADLAAAGPVLLVLEDMHWADRSTRDLVTFLSRVLHRERIAVVLTYRTDDLHRRHPLRPVVAELQRLPSVTAIDLRPLSAVAMAEHLTALSGGLLTWPVLDQVISRAEGNAYYAEELLTASPAGLADNGGGGTLDGSTGLPAGLSDLLLARMERLSAAAQRVLRVAAVAGRHVDDELVMRASGLGAAEYEEATREAVAARLLVADGDRGLAFRHALLREAVYGDLMPGERTRLHGLLAELLSDESRLGRVAGSAAELAYHALASHDIPAAFAASVQAGAEAVRLAAPAEAHRHYDLALSLWERVTDPEKLGGVERGDLTLRSALAAADAGDISRAAQQLRRLLSFINPAASPELASRANQRLAVYLLDLDQDSAALAAARAAVDALPADPPSPRRAQALATLAHTLLGIGEYGLAQASAEEARAAGRAGRRPLGGRRRAGHPRQPGRAQRAAQDRRRLLRAGAGPGPPVRHARCRAPRDLPGRPPAARERRPGRRERHRAPRASCWPARPAWPWRRTGTTCSTCITSRTTTTGTGTTPRRSPTASRSG